MPGIRFEDAEPDVLAEAADENFVVHASTVQRRVQGMRVLEDDGLTLIDSGLPCDTFNFVCRARLEPGRAAARAREVCAVFTEEGRPFSWWVGPADRPRNLGDVLVSIGLERAETELAMAADLDALDDRVVLPEGLRIARVRSRPELEDFARVNAANWTPPDRDVLRFYALGAELLLSSNCPLWLYVGYLGDTAVATAELTLGGGVVGLYNIATLAEFRRRGFGSALTLRPLLDAGERGYGTAVLQASDDGAGIYERVGFRRFGGITEYKPPVEGRTT
jgi:ribosomal protein S18 acetylase RimI-like enzyme